MMLKLESGCLTFEQMSTKFLLQFDRILLLEYNLFTIMSANLEYLNSCSNSVSCDWCNLCFIGAN